MLTAFPGRRRTRGMEETKPQEQSENQIEATSPGSGAVILEVRPGRVLDSASSSLATCRPTGERGELLSIFPQSHRPGLNEKETA